MAGCKGLLSRRKRAVFANVLGPLSATGVVGGAAESQCGSGPAKVVVRTAAACGCDLLAAWAPERALGGASG